MAYKSELWISHSKIADFLKCPRLYYLRHIYKDPKTGHKITVTSAALSLGQTVHEVVESLSHLPVEERFLVSPLQKLKLAWEKVSGKVGGFKDGDEEEEYKQRAIKMVQNVIDNPGPLLNKTVKLKTDPNLIGLSRYYLNEEEGIILSGKVDWIEYNEDDDSINIIDFKTGKNDEDQDSLQLPIYYLLASNLQKRPIKKASYWYLDRDSKPKEIELPSLKESYERVYDIAKRIKLAIQINHFKCPKGKDGCFACKQMERLLNGEGELVGSNGWQDIYILNGADKNTKAVEKINDIDEDMPF
ncbi:PD-(D/E)XK nuclease family protein [Candidatus Microgenomates bacterium]|nr:PD-(D/E)XK nuclease family protein [Candidatus Microgenomates bacterium]